MSDSEELKRFKIENDFILSKEVYEAIVKIAADGCVKRNVFKDGKDCNGHEIKCPPCLLKPIEEKIRIGSILANRHNPQEALDTYWQALYAIRCAAEHTGGKRATARRMRSNIEDFWEIANTAIETVKRHP